MGAVGGAVDGVVVVVQCARLVVGAVSVAAAVEVGVQAARNLVGLSGDDAKRFLWEAGEAARMQV